MDKSYFTEQTIACERKLYRIARTLLFSDADCEDALQEALLKAWTKRSTLRQPEYFETWLIRILINECRNIGRRIARERTTTIDVPDLSTSENPDLLLAIQALEENYRLVVVLYYFEGYSTSEIAKLLRLPTGTVKWRLKRARTLLKDELQEVPVCAKI